jgi:uncharacterized membrane protein (DUF2068 family)
VRFVRILGAVVIFYGLSYLQFGGVQLYEALYYRASQQVNWYVVASNFNIGIVTVVIGIGLILAKEWARVLWLMCSIVFLAIHIFLLAMFYTDRRMLTQQVSNTALIFILILISWTKLTRPDIKELFR